MADWSVVEREIEGGRHYALAEGGKPLTRGRVLDLLTGDAGFADWYSAVLAGSPFRAFYWENPPLDSRRLARPAEFVLMDAPELAGMRPDAETFSGHFGSSPGTTVVSFANLGGDALLVVPEPRARHEVYPQLAAFLRRGPREQVRELWQATGSEVRARLDDTPLWLSTSGTGVAWLHVRLDRRPKYYQYAPYREAA